MPEITGRRRSRPNASSGQQTVYNHPVRILIAEDSADNRILVKAYLKGCPYTLTFVEDGRGAVDEFTHRSFDLVLMDI